MLIGEYLHTLDSKKRLSLPAKFRKEVGRKVVITRGLDACLFMFPTKTWEGIAEKLEKLPFGQSDTRGMSRFILAGWQGARRKSPSIDGKPRPGHASRGPAQPRFRHTPIVLH